MKISYLIIDDEPLAHDVIEEYCNNLEFMEKKGNCYDAIEAISFLNKESTDLIFLDLNMPKLKGFDFLRTLDKPPIVIVTSAYKEYALEGFDLNICDYLLKPYSFERFLRAINKTKALINKNDGKILKKQSTDEVGKEKIMIKGKNSHHQLQLDDIIYIEASGNYSKLILRRSEIISPQKISDLEKTLPSQQFIRIHKSYIVALDKIKEIKAAKIILDTNTLPIGRMYKINVEKLLKKKNI